MIERTLTFGVFLWDNFVVGSPMLLVLVGFVVLFCWLAGEKPSWQALLPVGMFVFLLFLNLLWSFMSDIPPAVGKIVDGEFVAFDEAKDAALMIAMEAAQEMLLRAVERQGMENGDQLVIAVMQPALVNEIDWAKKIFLACIYGTAATYATVWMLKVLASNVDLLAKLTTMGLWFAEIWTMFVHVIGCDLIVAGADRTELNRIWGMTTYTAVCDREMFWGFEAIFMALFLLFMVWLVYHYSQVRTLLGLKNN